MLSNEIFLRSEIDRLEAEVLWLKFQLADLKAELAELKGKVEDKKEDTHPTQTLVKSVS